ncbi:PsbP-related protein [Nonlabens sp.]|uniref:PsbP-related protein n=1 Tax=Nonlabens sp. TaxID=1888209 RepID=UPI003263BB66
MKISLTLLLAFLLLTSCKNTTDTNINIGDDSSVSKNKHQGNGFSFSYPTDWNVTDDELIEEGLHYMAVEKKGINSSGLMTVVSFDYTMDQDLMIDMNIEELKLNSFINNLNFAPIEDDVFSTIKSRSSSFEFSTMGLKHQGKIIAFTSEGSSYVLLTQEALEDHQVNLQGFRIIENSFSID